ncbi:NAD(P)/FAD-dependent oxidoreductase [Tumidithrix helvetica PCC 7403]|uniref:NAD(P)/FAD-dependent oxidoreductase n=1 Tax=Tumidithrix helvetica TaxID=3457545 RepID=UPI003CA1FEAA
MNQANQPTVILGGGFVGLFTALHLSRQNYPHPIILIDRHRNFNFKPLLYELLSGEMPVDRICPHYTELLAGSEVVFIQGNIQTIDLHKRHVTLESGKTFFYANLVLALGGKTTYFHTPGAQENAFPFTSEEEVFSLSHRIKENINRAAQSKDAIERRQLLTVVAIGAGPAGVELACTLGDLMPIWCAEAGANPKEARIVLINRSDEILKGDVNSRLRDTAKAALKECAIPVDSILGAAVTAITPEGVEYKQQEQVKFLPAKTIAWTAGSEPNPLLKDLPIPPEQRDRRGRLQVRSSLQLMGFPNVFVGGDCAFVKDDPQPATAQVAYQQGTAIASNLMALAKGGMPKPAHIAMRGTLMKLGLGKSVANLFDRVEIKGKSGHLVREATYLELLPTPVHNLKVTTEWLTDEIFQRHQPQVSIEGEPEIEIDDKPISTDAIFPGIAAIAAGLILALPLTLRAANPQQFHQNFHWSGIPTLLDRLAPPNNSNS